MRALLVEDETDFAASLADGLRAEGFAVTVAHDGNAGFELARSTPYDCVVLDIMLPGRNGYRVCRDLRAEGVTTPVLMLTAKDGELDEAEALDIGADDFLRKPFAFVVLLARLRALVRRAQNQAERPTRMQCGDLHVDLGQHRCSRGEHDVPLTRREFDVLAALMQRAPEVLPKQELVEQVWGIGFDGDPNVAEVYIGYLRRKIDEPFGRRTITTLRGVGYRLDANG